MKLAIDIGSNTIKCLLGFSRGGIVERVYEKSLDSRISSGSELVADAAQKISESVKFFISESKKFASDFSIEAVATSALRDAKNKAAVCEEVFASTGVFINILSGEEEAELSYSGAMSDVSVDESSKNVFFDLGGGSMEIVYGCKGSVTKAFSLQLGAVKMTKRFLPTGADVADGISQIEKYASEIFEKNLPRAESFDSLVGVGGAVVAGRFMKKKLGILGEENIISRDDFCMMLNAVKAMSLEERVAEFGISPNRADILPAAFACVIQLMKFLEKKRLVHTFFNIRYGLILRGK